MKTRIFINFFAAMLYTLSSYSQDGASVFKKNCGVCHTIGNGKLVGPDLKGSDKKHDITWLTQWIKSSQTMIKKKDPKALQIFNDNKQMIMPDQPLSDEEIKTLMAFIGEETTKLEQPQSITPTQIPAATQNPSPDSSSSSIGINSTTIIYILLAIITFLTAILIGLSRIIKNIAESKKNDA